MERLISLEVFQLKLLYQLIKMIYVATKGNLNFEVKQVYLIIYCSDEDSEREEIKEVVERINDFGLKIYD